MYIKEVKKSNTPNGKVFYQYQLSETYRVDGKVMQNAILYLGTHELLRNKENRAIVANLLERKIKNIQTLSDDFVNIPLELKQLAEQYYLRYIQKQQKVSQKDVPEIKEVKANNKVYDEVDLNTTQLFDCREIGSEWMCSEILNRLGLKEFLGRKGWNPQKIDNALISIISRAVASYSEHKTESWLNLNSGLTELFNLKPGSISRHTLYRASDNLYSLKSELEEYLYSKMTTLFDLDDSILIYDLTNTYFEGRKIYSKIAKFGRNKDKRNDCKQVVLAAVINKDGFLKHSNIYKGNMSDPLTLIDIISKMGNPDKSKEQKPLIVIDAGIATDDNLKMLNSKGYLYVCVSRSKPHKDYTTDKANPVIVNDKRGNEIKLKYMDSKGSQDRWIYVKSNNKTKKEDSMLGRSIDKFELEMLSVRSGISKKGGTKKAEKVWERIGRIKERNKSVHKYYDIKVEVKDGIVIKIEYIKKEIEAENKQSGEYYLRTNYTLASEEEIWGIYNTIREVESTFRCLKTDLRLRPVHHQEDRYCEAHLHLGLLAYQIVAPIRFMLKKAGINYDWRNILRIMNTQKVASISIINKDINEVIIRRCSRPTQEVLEIYKALDMNSVPIKMKKFVVHH